MIISNSTIHKTAIRNITIGTIPIDSSSIHLSGIVYKTAMRNNTSSAGIPIDSTTIAVYFSISECNVIDFHIICLNTEYSCHSGSIYGIIISNNCQRSINIYSIFKFTVKNWVIDEIIIQNNSVIIVAVYEIVQVTECCSI